MKQITIGGDGWENICRVFFVYRRGFLGICRSWGIRGVKCELTFQCGVYVCGCRMLGLGE